MHKVWLAYINVFPIIPLQLMNYPRPTNSFLFFVTSHSQGFMSFTFAVREHGSTFFFELPLYLPTVVPTKRQQLRLRLAPQELTLSLSRRPERNSPPRAARSNSVIVCDDSTQHGVKIDIAQAWKCQNSTYGVVEEECTESEQSTAVDDRRLSFYNRRACPLRLLVVFSPTIRDEMR